MKYAIISAMQEELEPIISKYKCKMIDVINNQKIYIYKIDNKEIYLLNCGIGKVNATTTTLLFLSTYKVDVVFNIGTSGGIHDDLQITDLVLADKLAFHDVDVTAFGYELGTIPGSDKYLEIIIDQKIKKLATEVFGTYHVGTVLTGDQFINSGDKKKYFETNFTNVYACEMESAAIVNSCKILSTPVYVLRTISDMANKKSNMDFDIYLENVCQKFIKLFEYLLEEGFND